ncbi:MAG: hypothetical protein ISS28_06430 [Candidatus Cloacimonetes bacterium]|nr:hypothetical protein [Candidatus Cloacimonadota bacterium]
MIRRFNYTNRVKIPHQNIKIFCGQDDPSSFSAEIDINDYEFPEYAKVYIEAGHRTDYKRFNFGTVKNITPQEKTTLKELTYIEKLRFKILIVDETGRNGIILGKAESISPVSNSDRESILSVKFEDIGREVWNLNFDQAEGEPLLIINNKIIENIAKSSPIFFMFVYPVVFREILLKMLIIDGVDDINNPSRKWQSNWLKFALRINPRDFTDIDFSRDLELEEKDMVLNWIDDTISEFCNKRNEWDEFIEKINIEE